MNPLNTVVVLVIVALVSFTLGYAFRGFISRELVKAANEAKEYLTTADEYEDKVDAAVTKEVKKL